MSSDEPLQSCTTHGKNACKCYINQVVDSSLVQSEAEILFEKGLWGIINRGAPVFKVREFLEALPLSQQQAWAAKKDASGYEPLHYAVRRRDADGALEISQMLIRLGADCAAYTPQTRMSALHRAAAVRHVSVVELLLKNGAVKEFKDHQGLTAFDWVERDLFPGAAATKDEGVKKTLLAMLKPQEGEEEESA